MVAFSKYQGLGNDFIILNGVQNHLSTLSNNEKELELFIRKACNRRFGIGADGLIAPSPAEGEGDAGTNTGKEIAQG